MEYSTKHDQHKLYSEWPAETLGHCQSHNVKQYAQIINMRNGKIGKEAKAMADRRLKTIQLTALILGDY